MLVAAEHPFVSMASHSTMLRTHSRRGLTLLELIVVMAVLVALATMVVPILDNFASESRMTATEQTLVRLQQTINNRYATDMKGAPFVDPSSGTSQLDPNNMSLNKGLPVPNPATASFSGRLAYYPQLAFLFIDPTTLTQTATTYSGTLGWRGPYMTAGGAVFPWSGQTMPNGRTAAQNGFYGSDGATPLYGNTTNTSTTSVSLGWVDPAVIDAWGSPIVIQPTVTSTTSGPFSFTLSAAATTSYSGSMTLSTTMALTNSALVSAGPDGILNSVDDVILKIQ